jgi:hypothetical protein
MKILRFLCDVSFRLCRAFSPRIPAAEDAESSSLFLIRFYDDIYGLKLSLCALFLLPGN